MSHEMHNLIDGMDDMEYIKKTLVSWLKEEVGHGKECFDTKSCGAVSDIIKDIAETIKECYETCYYKTVIEAMSEGEEPAYGYTPNRNAIGQFTSRGKSVRGYMPYLDQMTYTDAYMHDPEFKDHMGNHNTMKMGYTPTHDNSDNYSRNSKDGEIYDNYYNAKRHYQNSRSAENKEKMEEHCMMYMDNSLKNLKSMWKDADPMLKAKMKKDLKEEISEILEDA